MYSKPLPSLQNTGYSTFIEQRNTFPPMTQQHKIYRDKRKYRPSAAPFITSPGTTRNVPGFQLDHLKLKAYI